MNKLSLFFIWITCSIGFAQELKFATFNADKKMASCVAFSNEGRLATSSFDGKIYFWNTSSGSTDNLLEGHKDIVLSTVFSADASLLASGGKDKDALVWSVKSGVIKFRLKGHTEAVTSVAISYDNKYLASGSADKTIKIWDLQSGTLLKTLTYHTKEISGLCFSNRHNTLVSSSYDGTVKLYNVETGEVERQFNPNAGRTRSVAISPDDRLLAIGTDDESIKLWEISSGTVKKTFKGHSGNVYDVEFSPDGKYLASGCLNNEVIIWSLEMAENIHSLKGFYKFLSLSFSKDGKELAIADLNSKFRVYDLTPLKISPDPVYEKWSRNRGSENQILTRGPKMQIGNPVSTKGDPKKVDGATIRIEGQVKADNGLFLLLVDGAETEVDASGKFTKDIKLKYYDNEIIVKAIDLDKKVSQDTVFVYRVFDKTNQEEVAGMKRNGKDYALLIGTDNYESMPHLANPVNDVNTVAIELEKYYGYKVEKIINPTLNEIYSSIRKYSKTIFSEDDQLFIFIAGHGEYDPVFKEGYLVAKDSKKDDESKLTYLSHSNLRTLVSNIPCKHIFLTLDACFGGTFDQAIGSRGGEGLYNGIAKEEFIHRKLKYKTRIYVTSGGKEYVPDGRPGQHSPFTRKFLDALRSYGGEDGILTINELFNFVEKVNPEPRKGEFGDNQPGSDFLFIRKQ